MPVSSESNNFVQHYSRTTHQEVEQPRQDLTKYNDLVSKAIGRPVTDAESRRLSSDFDNSVNNIGFFRTRSEVSSMISTLHFWPENNVSLVSDKSTCKRFYYFQIECAKRAYLTKLEG